MKVILTKDVPKVGQRGNVKNVPDGYAVNLLIPKGLAVAATAENLARHEKEMASRNEARALEAKLVEAHFTKAGDEVLVISAPANEQGHLFKAVNAKVIAAELDKKRNVSLPESAIVLDAPIKSVGPHTVQLHLKDKKQVLHILIEKGK